MPATRDTPTIEAARPEDMPAIRTLLRQAGLPHEDIAAHRANFLVARQDGAVIGAVGFELHGEEALLRSLVVAPAARGTGVGDRLVREITKAARGRRARRFHLLTTTAEGFFVRRGFGRIARNSVPAAIAATPEFQGLCPASAVCLTKELGE